MGYSIFVTGINTETVKDFINNQYIPICNLLYIYEPAATLTSHPTYCGDYSRMLGFDYSSWISFAERVYINMICHFMREKISGSKVVYDGYEEETLMTWREYASHWISYVSRKERQIAKDISESDILAMIIELSRLEVEWFGFRDKNI